MQHTNGYRTSLLGFFDFAGAEFEIVFDRHSTTHPITSGWGANVPEPQSGGGFQRRASGGWLARSSMASRVRTRCSVSMVR